MDAYTIAMCRPGTDVVFGKDGSVNSDTLGRNIETYCALIAQAAREHDARLVAFPQFALTGYAPLKPEQWLAGSLDAHGPEIARIAAAARAAGAYVVIQFPERHAAFPGRYFLSAALLTPEGEVGLVHRKHYTLSLRTSPNDIHDAFVREFGADAFYPVLDTPLGRIGLTIGGEVHWPEAIRSLALKGAELVINPIAAAGHVDYLLRPGAEQARSVRAFENVLCLGMVNVAGEGAPPAVYDHTGASVGRTVGDGVFTVATVELAELRRTRGNPGANLLAQIQPAIHEDLGQFPLWPKNAFRDHAPDGFEALLNAERESWQRLQDFWNRPE